VIPRLSCLGLGHVWSEWRQSPTMPTRSRVCQRCGKRERLWNVREPLRIKPRPTLLQRLVRKLVLIVNVLIANAKYASYVARHKFFVFKAGLQMKAPIWRLVIHDYSKLSRAEWGPYVRRFYGGRPGVPVTDDDSDDFRRAWLHHQHRNPHHWQAWILRQDDGQMKVLRMPEHFAREMVADWMGAGRAITGRWAVYEWYQGGAGEAMLLHPETRKFVESLLWPEKPSDAGRTEDEKTPVQSA